MANIQVLTFAMFLVASCINVGSAMVKPPVYPGSKPGTCPGGMSHCAIEPNQCFKDEDCPGVRKCCMWPCGGFNYCVKPRRSSVYPGSKPGMCPRVVVGVCEMRQDQCFNDEDCPAVRKCCRRYCGGFNYCAELNQSSVAYLGAKRGMCPLVDVGVCEMRPNQCFNDEDCPAVRKCCRWPSAGFNYCAEPSRSSVVYSGHNKAFSTRISFCLKSYHCILIITICAIACLVIN